MHPLLLAAVLSALPSQPVKEAEALLSAPRWPSHLSPKIAFAYRLARAQAGRDDRHWLIGTSVTQSGLRVTLRFTRDVKGSDIDAVESRGCTATRLPSKVVVRVGPVLEADCRWSALAGLAAIPDLFKVTPTFDAVPLAPLGVPPSTTLEEVEAPALRRANHPLKATGAGVTVIDIDSAADVFHPFLFRANGGRFAWIDVDKNGTFAPAIDGVDINKDGVLNVGELLRMQKAAVYSIEYAPTPGWKKFNDTNDFIAGVDWLYQDENGSGAREFGAVYGESKPGFGESVFVVDDVDGDGVLDVGERLVRLGTSKIKALLDFQTGNPVEFTRGTNLIQFSAPADEQLHGSMVLGSIAGGDANLTRFHGIAPDAELLLAYRYSTSSLLSSLMWAQQKNAQIALWEMATWYFEPLDGSSDLEAACDSAHLGGMLQIGAAGNLGGSKKHTVFSAATGTTTALLSVPKEYSAGFGGNLNLPGATMAAISLTLGAATVALTGPQGSTQLGPFQLQWFTDTSARNTSVRSFYLGTNNQLPLTTDQTITVTVTNTSTPATVHGYIFDNASSWGQGVYWLANTTDANTYGVPSTSDRTMAIGTWLADFPIPPRLAGELADHSSRGPRRDGMDTIDLVAPEDHITSFTRSMLPWGQLWVGGGTSNASPVAVGVAAALLSLQPTLTPDQLAAQLRTGARAETQMGTLPNDNWGSGKLSAYRSRYAMAPVAVLPPVARGTVTVAGGVATLNASTSSDPQGLALSYRWDADDDGVNDAVATATPIVTLSASAVAQYVTLEVANSKGAVSRVRIEKPALVPDAGMPDAGAPDAGLPDAGLPDAGMADAGIPDAGLTDGGVPDAGAEQPDASVPFVDGGKLTDGGTTTEPPPKGCGCSTGSEGGLFALAALLLSASGRRRRACRPS
jgi:MYXO-CTERM domain-containing protein